MTALRTLTLAAFVLFGLAIAVPAGSSTTGSCGPLVDIRDPGLRASFARFDSNQSVSAAQICAFYLNGVSTGR